MRWRAIPIDLSSIFFSVCWFWSYIVNRSYLHHNYSYIVFSIVACIIKIGSLDAPDRSNCVLNANIWIKLIPSQQRYQIVQKTVVSVSRISDRLKATQLSMIGPHVVLEHPEVATLHSLRQIRFVVAFDELPERRKFGS